MDNFSPKKFISVFYLQIIIVFIAIIIEAKFLWSSFPLERQCCDAGQYLALSDELLRFNGNSLGFRTLGFPLFLAVVRYLPLVLNWKIENQVLLVSIIQLTIHIIASILLAYSISIATKSKIVSIFTLFLYGMNPFLLVYTNHLLTDGLGVSFLTIALSLILISYTGWKNDGKRHIFIIMIIMLVLGYLSTIRPSYQIVSIVLYLYTLFFIVKRQIPELSVQTVAIGSVYWIFPLVQLYINPNFFLAARSLATLHQYFSSYMYKYVSIVEPRIYGYAAISRDLVSLMNSACQVDFTNVGSVRLAMADNSTYTHTLNCMNMVFSHHPLLVAKHHFLRLFSIIDQVNLTPYIIDMWDIKRHGYRALNCFFLSSYLTTVVMMVTSTISLLKKKKDIKIAFRFIKIVSLMGLIFISLIFPYLFAVPEERFGLMLFPFITVGTSVFLSKFFDRSFKHMKSWIYVFSFLFLLFLGLSIYIETGFGIIMND